MRWSGWLLLAMVALAMPSELWAQGRGRGHDDDRRERRIERRDQDDDWRRGRLERERDDDRGERRVAWRRDDDDDWRERRVDRRLRSWRDVRSGDRRWGDDVIALRDERGRIFVVDRSDFERLVRIERGRGRGPSFCRDGRGHPVYGRRWCLEKGFGLGIRRDVFDQRGRLIFRIGDQVVILRRDDQDRGTIERIVENILLAM